MMLSWSVLLFYFWGQHGTAPALYNLCSVFLVSGDCNTLDLIVITRVVVIVGYWRLVLYLFSLYRGYFCSVLFTIACSK